MPSITPTDIEIFLKTLPKATGQTVQYYHRRGNKLYFRTEDGKVIHAFTSKKMYEKLRSSLVFKKWYSIY